MKFSEYPHAAELLNALTHGVGVIIFLVLVPLLIALAVNTRVPQKIWGAMLFSFGLLAVYFSSTIFHAIPEKVSKDVLNYFDLLSIYLLISGTYSPFLLIYFRNKLGKAIMVILWFITVVGITSKLIVDQLPVFITLIIYIIMGWVGIIMIRPALRRIKPKVLWFILLGGLSYTAGTYFFYHDGEVYYYHAVWHIFVLVGSLLNYCAVLFAILDKERK